MEEPYYSALPDLLKNFLEKIGDTEKFEGLLKNSDVSFFLDEPDFRQKLMSRLGWTHTLTEVDVQSLCMTGLDAQILCRGFWESDKIRKIRAGYQRSLGDAGAEAFARLLLKNTSLTELELPHTNIGVRGASELGMALTSNNSLVRLDLSSNCLGFSGIETLLQPLTGVEHQPPANTTLQCLLIGGSSNKLCKKGAKAVNRMLRTNPTLIELAVNLNPLSDSGVLTLVGPLIPARTTDSYRNQPNEALKYLTIGFARKAEGGNGAHDIIRMVEQNHTLEKLTLRNIQPSWEQDDVEKLLLALRMNSSLKTLHLGGCLAPELFYSLKEREKALKPWAFNFPFTIENQNPQSSQSTECPIWTDDVTFCKPRFARIILCGHPHSGQDELLRHIVTKHNGKSGIHVLEEGDDIKISIWHFSEPEAYDYFQTHLLLPNRARSEGSPTSFIILCSIFRTDVNAQKGDAELKEEISYWLRYLASSITTPTRLAPTVWVVFTDFSQRDSSKSKWTPPWISRFPFNAPGKNAIGDDHDHATEDLPENLENAIEDLAKKYKEVLTVKTNKNVVHDKLSAMMLKNLVCLESRNYQQDSPMVPRVCLQVSKRTRTAWIVPLHEVFEDWQKKNVDLQGPFKEERCNEVANALHDAGEILLFKELNMNMVILDPSLLISRTFPALLNLLQGSRDFSEGLISELTLQGKLSKGMPENTLLDGSQIVLLTRWLKMCYKSRKMVNEVAYMFVPKALAYSDGDIARSLSWSKNIAVVYLGRRYQSRDKLQSFLNKNFFHQLQLELLRDGNLANDGTYPQKVVTLQPSLIRIATDSLEILVEFGGTVGYFVDVMARSTLCSSQTLAFIHKYVRNTIQKLSKSTKGPEEGHIRQLCVRKLTQCKHRQVQMIKHLRAKLQQASCPLNYRIPWPLVEDEALDAGHDLAIACLDSRDQLDILKRRNISAPSKDLSDVLSWSPSRFTAEKGPVSLGEAILHNLFVRHMVQNNTELHQKIFLSGMPTFKGHV